MRALPGHYGCAPGPAHSTPGTYFFPARLLLASARIKRLCKPFERGPDQSREPAGRNGVSTQGNSPPFRRSAKATVSAMGVSPISAARNAR